MENQNLFDAENLYQKNFTEFEEFLRLPAELLIDDIALKYQNLIYQHVENSLHSGITIPSLRDATWFNTCRPLDFHADLKHRVFVLDFFTLCCINCIHTLEHLKKIELKYKETTNFVVLGVHSPKFIQEKEEESVKQALKKYNISHPVMNDPDLKIWKDFGVYCWPTVFIVGPGHSLLFSLVGEAQINKLPFLVDHILEYCSMSWSDYPVCELPMSTIDETCGAGKEAEYKLLFPGSISTNGKILSVSDTGNHKIIFFSRDLKIQETVGTGIRGDKDGEFHAATFNSPNGSTWYEDKVYVADTGNHSIREINFDLNIVLTVFNSKDVSQKFQSPWDVCMGPMLGTDFSKLNILYIAVAGTHQIWAVDLDPESASCFGAFAGSGKEENRANFYKMKAGFAQPSGIDYSSLTPDEIFIADSESSTVKSISLKNNGAVQIIVGGGRDPSDLFQFGDKDGKKEDCKLQHPMGIAVIGKNLLAIADTYNHKVKIVNVANKECFTLDQSFNLREPCGLCFMDSVFSNELSGKYIYVCDTNNHRIVPIQIYESILSSEQTQCETIIPLTTVETYNTESDLHKNAPEIELDYDGTIKCRFKWEIKKISVRDSKCDFEHQGDGLFKVEFLYPGGAFEGHSGYDPTLMLTSCKEHLDVKNSPENTKSSVKITCHVVHCDENPGVCRFFDATFEFSVKFMKHGSKNVELFLYERST